MTLIANLRHAARNRETVVIGGGEFGPAELAEAARVLELHSRLVSTLGQIVGQERQDQYGYIAASVAMDNDWRNRARDLYKEATGAKT